MQKGNRMVLEKINQTTWRLRRSREQRSLTERYGMILLPEQVEELKEGRDYFLEGRDYFLEDGILRLLCPGRQEGRELGETAESSESESAAVGLNREGQGTASAERETAPKSQGAAPESQGAARGTTEKLRRELRLTLRPSEDDAQWAEYAESFQEAFRNQQANYKIKGRPDTVKKAWREERRTEPAPDRGKCRFGLKIDLADCDEAFYGMGEAAKTGLNLKGGEYQNWAVYQFDEIPVPFVMSTGGWGMLINTDGRHFVDIGKRNPKELLVMGEEDDLDIFFFWGDSLHSILQSYTRITGSMMLLPKWAYGLTYIPSMLENQFELLSSARTLRTEHIPCDHISIEPQWMKVFYDYSLEKWWNEEKFHMPAFLVNDECVGMKGGGRGGRYSFINALNRYGFHVSLWLCNAYDFTDEAERIARGKEEGELEPWYRHLEKFVDSGIDGFKLDPADTLDTNCPEMMCVNGYSEMEMHNLSQVLLPMQVCQGMEKQLNQRPMLHYCGGYIGSQRWAAANTGDNGGLKSSMVWLQSLALSGHCNTTVDMDIHYLESLHYAMFAPWAHLNAWLGCSQPWWETPRMYQSFKEYARLRYRLLPYLYSTAIEAHETAMPILRPMPIAFPGDKKVRDIVEQYLFGPGLMVQSYSDRVVFPEGKWVDYWTGAEYRGGETIAYTPPENRGGGLFVKKGAILPMWEDRDYVTEKSETEIILDIWPDRDSSYLFREDDGVSLDYKKQLSCHTEIRCRETDELVRIEIGPRNGDYTGKPEKRIWRLQVHTQKEIQAVCAEADEIR